MNVGQYIATQCTNLIKDLKLNCPTTTVSGFVMDSASANRSAMEVLDKDAQVHPLVNLQCAAHMLSLLMKDIAKRFDWVSAVYKECLEISSYINGSENFRFLFEQQCTKDEDPCTTIATHCDSRFGSQYLVVTSCDRHIESLKNMVGSPGFLALVTADNENAANMHKMLSGRLTDNDGLVKRLPLVKEQCGPIMRALARVEADRASLSRMRALVRQLEAHVLQFDEAHSGLCADGVIRKKDKPDESITMIQVFHHRLREFYYKPALTAAFMLDPINFRRCDETVDLPFAALSNAEEDEAVADMIRLAGDQVSVVAAELADLKLNGIRNLSALNEKVLRQCMLVEEHEQTDGSVTRTSAPVEKRMQLWLKVLNQKYPVLSKVAPVYLSMHSTSCASERNLSVFGRLYDKLRSSLHLTRGEKMVYLAVNDRMQKGTLDASKEQLQFNDSDLEDDESAAIVEGGDGVPVAPDPVDEADFTLEPDPDDRRRGFFY